MKRSAEVFQTAHNFSKSLGPRTGDQNSLQTTRISLKQWGILNAVHDCGSFVAAGEQVHLSQSAISYRIGKIEQQLGIVIYELDGRKASLTDAGKQILMRSRILLEDAVELEDFAKRIALEHKRCDR